MNTTNPTPEITISTSVETGNLTAYVRGGLYIASVDSIDDLPSLTQATTQLGWVWDGDDLFATDVPRRDFMKFVGAGIAVFCLTGPLSAQNRRRRPQAPQDISAWLHIDKDGAVTFLPASEISQPADSDASRETLVVDPVLRDLIMPEEG